MGTRQSYTSVRHFFVVGLLSGLAMLIGCGVNHPSPAENKDAAEAVKAAKEINQATAEQLGALTGKIPFQVHGKLKKTEHESAKDENGKEKGYVEAVLIEDAAPVSINCYFALDQKESVCSLKLEEELTIRGQLHSVSKDSIDLIGCYVVAGEEK